MKEGKEKETKDLMKEGRYPKGSGGELKKGDVFSAVNNLVFLAFKR